MLPPVARCQTSHRNGPRPGDDRRLPRLSPHAGSRNWCAGSPVSSLLASPLGNDRITPNAGSRYRRVKPDLGDLAPVAASCTELQIVPVVRRRPTGGQHLAHYQLAGPGGTGGTGAAPELSRAASRNRRGAAADLAAGWQGHRTACWAQVLLARWRAGSVLADQSVLPAASGTIDNRYRCRRSQTVCQRLLNIGFQPCCC